MLGRIAESQCINIKCFTKCAKAHITASQAPVETTPVQENTVSANDTGNGESANPVKNTEKAQAKKVVATGKISNPAVEAHTKELRHILGRQLQDNKKFSLALQVVSLMKFTSYKLISNIDTSVAKLMKKSEEELTNMIDGIVLFAAIKSESFGGGDIKGASNLLAHSACVEPEGLGELIAQWTPTKDVLKNYTTAQLISVCKLSGFSEAMEKQTPDSFTKLSKGKKDVLLTAILETPFDWSNFAPMGYQALLPKA
ncbi:hypothetical protein L3081_25020 [Colwellia sp. MSW7]|uniref:Uncharacterized protein n=1 Tax=Colwellia maritima TaxID=2912588 RepID=A0ABS9X776_9GAMM|nr:hypothetical protein [Colwellia maritima]MCI2286088.1 hypothetical protein [Colwellia maritima]